MAVAADIRPAAAQNAIMAAVYPKAHRGARGRTDALPTDPALPPPRSSDLDELLFGLVGRGGGGASADEIGGAFVADKAGELGGGHQVGLHQLRVRMAGAGDVDGFLDIVLEAGAQLLHDLRVRGREAAVAGERADFVG